MMQQGPQHHNICALLSMEDYTVENALFDRATLAAYSAYNLGHSLAAAQKNLMSEEKGGAQGDYRTHMPEKIAEVVDCLTKFPRSKRALITILADPLAPHSRDDLAKCMREMYFHREGNTLHASCVFRAQAVSIFPKNLHFMGMLMGEIAEKIAPKLRLGTLFYYAVCVVGERSS
jgi:hypothetical protein